MPRTENFKIKLLLIAEYLYENSDENHTVTSGELIEMLEKNGCAAERKSVYRDVEILKSMGMDIYTSKGRTGGIKLLSRRFQLPELKLLVDSIQSSRFITEKKSYELIEKLGTLVSVHEREELNRAVHISDRIKNENEAIYYTTDIIYKAINSDRQIEFLYFSYGADMEKRYRNGKKPIRVSPFALQYDSEKYYLIAFDSRENKVKHYRVDKMEKAAIYDDTRDGKGYFRKFDIALYSNATINMFSGKITNVTLGCAEEFADSVIDMFGKKCVFTPSENGEYSVCVEAALSPTFYSWVFTFGDKIKILSPQKAVDEYKEQLKAALGEIN